MSGHGPDAGDVRAGHERRRSQPHKLDDTLAFMFESRYVIHPSPQALASPQLQPDYQACWQGLASHFTGTR